MTAAADRLRPPLQNDPAPLVPPKRGFSLREALRAIQQPVLAFITAFLVGSLIIMLTDLNVLAEFRETVGRLAAGAYQRLAIALVVALAAGWLLARDHFARLVQRFARTTLPPRVLSLIKLVLGLAALLMVYGLVRAAGFAEAIDAAFN